MRKRLLPVLATVLTTSLTPALLAQDGICNFDWHPHYEQLTRYVSGPGTSANDAKTWLLRSESATAPLSSLKETWYVARSSQGTETAAFNRLLGGTDNMDSPFSSEGSYSLQLALDFPWTSAATSGRTPAGMATSGLTPISRYLRASPFDHQTWLTSQTPAGYSLDATYNGVGGSPERLGYQRFGNLLTNTDVLGTNGSGPAYGTNFLDNSVLRVDFNKIWGNAVGRISQTASGRQIVLEPIGDMVQTVVRFPDADPDDPDCFNPNPTQSGSVGILSQTETWAGSPTLSSTKVTHDATTGLQSFTTVVRPFEFGNTRAGWSGVDTWSPLAWKGFIQRTDTLGCKFGSVTRKDVVKTTSQLILAPNNGLSSQNVLSLNTHWLRPADLANNTTPVVWNFVVECLNLHTGGIRQLLAGADLTTCTSGTAGCSDITCGQEDGNPATPPDDHAIIVTRQDGTFGFAVARFNLVLGEDTNIALRCGAAPCDTIDKGGIIIQANRSSFSSRSTINKTAWSTPLESFLIVNNRSSILTRLNELNSDDKSCVN
jgi:hypothetical protein